MEEQSTMNSQKKEVPPYKQCLNCGTDLQGVYCHKCGQQATNPTPKVWKFILEYMDNAFIWDTKCLPTICQLIRRPGYLTNEYNAGKFVAYENPLKLNMFFLFVFVTLFLLFSDIQKANESFDNVTRSELVRPYLSLNALNEDAEYSTQMKASERDTIQLAITTLTAKEYSQVVNIIRPLTNNGEEVLDTLEVAIPRILIQDKIIVNDGGAVYSFTEGNELVNKMLRLDLMSMVLKKMVDLLTQYFPLIILLTSPLLAFAVQLLHLKRKEPAINYFIFALHYTALIEFLLLVIYALHLVAHPGFDVLQWVMTLGSSLYLAVAYKNVYECNSWIKSIVMALLISLIYFLICFLVFFAIFIFAIFLVV
jgi:hypothetical protein